MIFYLLVSFFSSEVRCLPALFRKGTSSHISSAIHFEFVVEIKMVGGRSLSLL